MLEGRRLRSAPASARQHKDEYARSAWLGVAGTALAAPRAVYAASCRCGTAAAPTPLERVLPRVRSRPAPSTTILKPLQEPSPGCTNGCARSASSAHRSCRSSAAYVTLTIRRWQSCADCSGSFRILDLQVAADATRHGHSNNIRLSLSRAVLTERYPAKPPSALQPADVTARGAPEQSDVADTAGRTS
jgi:hypothetical protein